MEIIFPVKKKKKIFDRWFFFQVDGPALLLITEDDLRQPPLSLPCLGDIKRLSKAINELKSIQTPMENGIIDEKLQVDDTLGSIESMTQQAP